MAPGLFKQDVPSPEESRDGTGGSDLPTPIDRGRRRRADEPASLSVIGPGMEIVGEVRGRGDVQVEGRIEGKIELDGQVRVSSRGRLAGDVVVDRLVVAGEVEGSITARDSTELLEGCRVDADVQSPRLVLASGGVLNGRIDMSKPSKNGGKAEGGDDRPKAAVGGSPERAAGVA